MIKGDIQDLFTGTLTIMPGASKKITIRVNVDFRQGIEHWIEIYFVLNKDTNWAPKGHTVAWQQHLIPLSTSFETQEQTLTALAQQSEHELICKEEDGLMKFALVKKVSTQNAPDSDPLYFFAIRRCDASILLCGKSNDPAEISQSSICSGPLLNLWRAPTDNDYSLGYGPAPYVLTSMT